MTNDRMAGEPAGVGVIVVQIPSRDTSDHGSGAHPSPARTLKAPVSRRTVRLVRDTNAVFLVAFIVFLLFCFFDLPLDEVFLLPSRRWPTFIR
jgi:hypothetical protein